MIEYEYRCDDCGRGFLTENAANGHRSRCPAIERGDEDDEQVPIWVQNGTDRSNRGRVAQALDDLLSGASEPTETTSRELAGRVDQTPNAVAQQMSALQRCDNQYRIEMRGSSPTTWVVQRDE